MHQQRVTGSLNNCMNHIPRIIICDSQKPSRRTNKCRSFNLIEVVFYKNAIWRAMRIIKILNIDTNPY